MDEITEKVVNMYGLYPYPSPTAEAKRTNELLNLLRIFSIENQYKIDGKNILDAGTGTGHRLIQVASFYKKNCFMAIDYSRRSIEIAKELAKKQNLNNIDFEILNLDEDLSNLGKFDIIFCMGVLHHLSDPVKGLQNLCSILNDDGIIFIYLYGRLGSHQRMKRKKIISLLLGENKHDYKNGIKLVRELNFNSFEYGWNIDFQNEQEEDSLIVDAFLHANETLYDFDGIDSLMQDCGLYGYSVYGITTGKTGLLFDTRVNVENKTLIPHTNLNKLSISALALKSYELLNLKDRCRVIDLLYEPNGYTLIGFTKKAYDSMNLNGRIKSNFIVL